MNSSLWNCSFLNATKGHFGLLVRTVLVMALMLLSSTFLRAQETKATSADSKTILLTGFEPFGADRSANASWEAVRQLDGKELHGYRLRARQLKVEWGAPQRQLEQYVRELNPCAIFAFGQGGGGSFALECRAACVRGGHPDNNELVLGGTRIFDDGPEILETTFATNVLLDRLSASGYPIRRSESAGRYLCEEALYSLEYLKSKGRAPNSVSFCHVPPLGTFAGVHPVTPEFLQQFVVSFVTGWIEQVADADQDRARAEIQKLVDTYFQSWSDQDLKTYGECFLEGAVIQYLSADGAVLDVSLRDEFLAGQKKAHQASPERMREFPEKTEIHFVGRVAQVAVRWRLEAGPKRVFGYDHFTLVRRNGQWRIATLVFYADPAAPPPDAGKPGPVKPQNDQPKDELPQSSANVDAFLEKLGAIVFQSIQRKDTSSAAFHGCLDWHSAVHGHWALLRIARSIEAENEEKWKTFVRESLSPVNVNIERQQLREKAAFEMPYGRAWLLRLISEVERTGQEETKSIPAEIQTLGDETGQSLLAYYENRTPSVATREYNNDCWALIQMSDYFEHRGDEPSRKIVAEIIDTYFVKSDSPVRFSLDQRQPDFFSPFGNWVYLIARSQDSPTLDAFLQTRRPTDQELMPISVEGRNSHPLGLNWSRAWSLRAASQKLPSGPERQRLEDAYWKHVQAGMEEYSLHAGDYSRYDHWVPQFAVYALTE